MKITRIYTGPDNRSHFEDIEIPLDTRTAAIRMSEPAEATGVIFGETDGSHDYDWHTAPRRQYLVMLVGEVEIEVGDGTKRVFRAGDIVLAEDTTGQGHFNRALNDKTRKYMFVTLE